MKCVSYLPVAHIMKEKSMTTSTPPATIPPEQGPIWHTLSIEEALRAQSVDAATGLSHAEDADREIEGTPRWPDHRACSSATCPGRHRCAGGWRPRASRWQDHSGGDPGDRRISPHR